MTSDAYREIVGGSNVRPINKRGTRWVENQELPPEWIEDGYAQRAKYDLPRINLKLEAERFVNSALMKGRIYINWRRAWLNWVISPWCKGEPEAAPERRFSNDEEMSVRRVKAALTGARSAFLDAHDVRIALAKGEITREEARRLGF